MIKTHLSWGDIELNLLTLTFPPEVENIYKGELFKKSLLHVRFALLLSIVFFGGFGILDAWIVPEAKYRLWFIRYAVYCPFALAIFLYSYSKSFKKNMQICIAAVVALAGFGIIAMIMVVPHSGNSTYYAGLILVFIFGYTFFKLDFIYAASTGIMIVIAYEIAAIWFTHTPIPILINNNFFFLSGNLFGMFACFSIELLSRKEFMQTRLLETEKKKVHQANLELEYKVEQRTGQLLKANKVLKQEIAERNRAEESLKKAYQELKQTQSQLVQSGKLASIGELAAGVAHELNQPLMVIRGNAQLIQRNISKGKLKIEDMHKQIEPIEKNTKRMMTIINHLRAFSRQSKAEYYALNVNNVIEESFLMVGEQLRLRNIEVKKSLDPQLPQIKGDTNQLEQVFLNLITNARDAIMEKFDNEKPMNGDTESMEIITKPSDTDDSLIEILFKDSGSGIKEKDQTNIFDPFYTTKEVGKGTGLGLSISYGIINDHKGQIEVAETGPEGTMFKVTLPIADLNSDSDAVEEEKVKKTA